MLAKEIDSSLLTQQLEFLQIELKEVKSREERMKSFNSTILEAMNNTDYSDAKVRYIQDQIITELTRSNDLKSIEIHSLKERLKYCEQENKHNDLTRHSLDIKVLRENINVKSQDLSLTLLKQREFEEKTHYSKEQEIRDLKTQHENYTQELKSIYKSENEHLRGLLANHQTKLRNSDTLIGSLYDKISLLEEKNRELVEQSFSRNDYLQFDKSEILFNKISELEIESENKNENIRALQLKLETAVLGKDKTQIELDRTLLELKQLKLNTESNSDASKKLKNEIKYLIRKLLKAKSTL